MRKNKATIKCPSCGQKNNLGLVFCAGCGKRLPAQAITARQVSSWQDAARKMRAFRRFLSNLLFLVVLFVLGLIFWPVNANIGGVGNLADGEMLESQLRSLIRARDGGLGELGEVRQSLKEAELNAYFQMIGREDYSIELLEDGLVVRHRRTWWKPSYLPETWHPTFRVEAVYALREGSLKQVGARCGKMRVPKLFSSRVDDYFKRSLKGIPAWRRLDPVIVDEIEEGEITFLLKPSEVPVP